MGYENMSINKVFEGIKGKTLVLPALQRNYVWKEEQICNLFDSLMKGYPIGSFLFWNVADQDRANYHFHSFSKKIDLSDKNNIRGVRGDDVTPQTSVTAVLDGQQRITSLLVGLKGSYKSVVKKIRKNDDGSYPERYLSLNLLHFVNDTAGENYEFEFLSEKEIAIRDDSHCWFRLSELFKENFTLNNLGQYVLDLKVTSDFAKGQKIINMLTRLYHLVFEETNISYYTAEKKDLSEAVEIFERVNNNGKQLSGTDLMLSMASASSREDMHEKITEAIKEISNATNDETGFEPDKDFILTAMLMAVGKDDAGNYNIVSTTAKANYTKSSIDKINKHWESVVEAISSASIYIELLGFNGRKLGKSFLHPIAYYFYKRGSDLNPRTHAVSNTNEAQEDRNNITQWLLRAQIKQIFAYGIPSTLGSIRKQMDSVMDKSEDNPNPVKVFPLQHLMEESDNTGKTLKISNTDISSILEWKYGNEKIVPLFTVILKESLGTFDVDHMWPQEKMSSDSKIAKAAKQANVQLTSEQIAFYKDKYNLLPNLQLLKRTPNSQKSQDFYNVWIEKAYPDDAQRNTYISNYCVPTDSGWSYGDFIAFYAARKAMLTERLRTYFDVKDS